MNSGFLVEDRRYLLKFFAAKSPAHTLLFVIPMIVATSILLSGQSFSATEVISLTIGGFVYWSLAEYIIHRWIFHFKSKYKFVNFIRGSFHTYHHQNPKDLEVLTSGWITAIFGIFLHGSIFFFSLLGP